MVAFSAELADFHKYRHLFRGILAAPPTIEILQGERASA